MNDLPETTKRSGKTNGYSNHKLHAKLDRKRQEAEDRQAEHDSLTLKEKIDKAKSRRGNSTREISRLTAKLGATGVKVSHKTAPDILNDAPPKSVKKSVAKSKLKK